LEGKCNCCGMCCSAITVSKSMKQITNCSAVRHYIETGEITNHEEFPDTIVDALFIYLNWKQISEHEAFKINPYLKKWGRDKGHKRFFYTCTKFDKENRVCTVHDHNPKVCRKFPWYDGKPIVGEILYSPNCGYTVDTLKIKQEAV
jgi:Fe-S-cluster containining protein